MPVTGAQRPVLDLLEKTGRQHVLIVPAGAHPAIKSIPVEAKSFPAKVLPEQKRGLDRGGTVTRGKRKIPVVASRQDTASPERKRGHPRKCGVSLVPNLVA